MSLLGDNRIVREANEREVRIYATPEDRAPFEEWVAALGDKRAKARIFTRVDRVRLGNFGDCCSIGGGVHELRVDYGPGYRVYFGLLGSLVVLLLCGGTKETQKRDIEMAHRYWKEVKVHGDQELR